MENEAAELPGVLGWQHGLLTECPSATLPWEDPGKSVSMKTVEEEVKKHLGN
jgi:hypothetical protein